VLPASVSGYVYLDQANNGIKTPDDPGIGGVQISLSGTDDLGQSVSFSGFTDGNGFYSFGSLRPGNYTITKTDPAGYLKGQDTIGNLGGTVGYNQLSLTLTPNADGINYNFGELLPPTIPTIPPKVEVPPQTPPAPTPPTPQIPPPATPNLVPDTGFDKRFFFGGNWLT
jgi:hypothetical protein